MAGAGHGAGEFAGKRRVVGSPFAEAAYLGRDDHEAALGQGAAEVLVVAVGLPALRAVLPQPDDVAHAVAVAVQGQHARRRSVQALRHQHPYRHRGIRPRTQHDALPHVGSAVHRLLPFRLHRRRRPIQEAQGSDEYRCGVLLPRARGFGGGGGKCTIALRTGMQRIKQPERVEFGSLVHAATVGLVPPDGKQSAVRRCQQ